MIIDIIVLSARVLKCLLTSFMVLSLSHKRDAFLELHHRLEGFVSSKKFYEQQALVVIYSTPVFDKTTLVCLSRGPRL